jgi:hypothetical protein
MSEKLFRFLKIKPEQALEFKGLKKGIDFSGLNLTPEQEEAAVMLVGVWVHEFGHIPFHEWIEGVWE